MSGAAEPAGSGRPSAPGPPVESTGDHVAGGGPDAVTLVEYGDFECPYCGGAEPQVQELRRRLGDRVRFVFRHLPLDDVHPNARRAAEAAEAAGAQGAFWPMHDRLYSHQRALAPEDLRRDAEELGLDVERFEAELRDRVHAARVQRDVDEALRAGVGGTPAFFVDGRRYEGFYDADSLADAIDDAAAAR
jgi:protein-disulfide isomerase